MPRSLTATHVLDDAAEAVDHAVEITWPMITRAQTYDRSSMDAAEARKEFDRRHQDMHEAVQTIAVHFRRVALLVGRKDALTEALGRVQAEFFEIECTPPGEIAVATTRDDPERHEVLAAQLAGIRTVQFGFLDLAEQRVGIRLPRGSLQRKSTVALNAEGRDLYDFYRELGLRTAGDETGAVDTTAAEPDSSTANKPAPADI